MAGEFDRLGLRKEADKIDAMIRKVAGTDRDEDWQADQSETDGPDDFKELSEEDIYGVWGNKDLALLAWTADTAAYFKEQSDKNYSDVYRGAAQKAQKELDEMTDKLRGDGLSEELISKSLSWRRGDKT